MPRYQILPSAHALPRRLVIYYGHPSAAAARIQTGIGKTTVEIHRPASQGFPVHDGRKRSRRPLTKAFHCAFDDIKCARSNILGLKADRMSIITLSALTGVLVKDLPRHGNHRSFNDPDIAIDWGFGDATPAPSNEKSASPLLADVATLFFPTVSKACYPRNLWHENAHDRLHRLHPFTHQTRLVAYGYNSRRSTPQRGVVS